MDPNSVPANLKFPDALKNKIYYDTVAKTLHFVGVMTEAERTALLKLSADTNYDKAVNELFDVPDKVTPPKEDTFLTRSGTGSDTATLFDDSTTEPLLLVLRKLLPYLRSTLSELIVKQRFSEYLKLDSGVIDALLKRWVNSPAHPTQKAIAEFLAPAFAESNPNIKSSKAAFPDQFDAFLLLHKIAILVLKFKITPPQLQWLFEYGPSAQWLDLNLLPLKPADSARPLFQAWARLADLFQLRDALPLGETLLTDVFTTAHAPGDQRDALLDKLSKGLQWEIGNLKSLSGAHGFNFQVNNYKDEVALVRLYAAFVMLKRLGASADQCLSWTKTVVIENDARDIKSLVRAKYDTAQWLERAKSLRDPLREKQRSALVSYLVDQRGVRNANELYDDFLIDVEMSPCMITTRIKQAISSVQLFIQRCLMNLESDVSLTPKEAQEWAQWRKQYRVWEVNRKVLLYPENWIEPELRDDKSPFFKELEDELLQSDVTMDTAETAFLHYLEKLDQVARLEIVGMYQQQEPKERDILHVFGRTYATAHIYFYRRLEGGVWSAWERVDLDVEGDHLIPVMWNRRLYLFWAIFTEKSEQPTKEQRTRDEDPNKYWEIKLAWSEYKNASWSPKKVSKKPLRHEKHLYPDLPQSTLNAPQEPQDVSFKTRILRGRLIMGCYGAGLVTEVVSSELESVPPVIPTTIQFFWVSDPHRDVFRNPFPTYLKFHFLISGVRPNATERSKIKMQIRDRLGGIQEVTLNSNGVAYSKSGYTDVVFVDLVSKGYNVLEAEENGSWWMPFNPVAYATAVVEACVDAVADKGIAVARTAVDTAVATAVIAAVATGGNIPAVIVAVTAAVTAAISSITVIDATKAASRMFGRRVIVNLETLPLPPPATGSKSVTKTTLEPMGAIGEFTLDDCNGDLVAVSVAQVTNGMVPTKLIPYPNTKIQSMQFVENSGE